MKNYLTKSFLIIAVIAFVFAIVLGVYDICIIWTNWRDSGYDCSFISSNITRQLNLNIGDYLWGTIGILLTFVATIFLFITFREQREQLRITKEESDKTRFETTYFNILGMLKQVQDTVNANIAARMTGRNIHNIVEFYRFFKDTYNNHLQINDNLRTMNESFNPINTNQAEIEQYKGLIAREYEDMIAFAECNIGYLYRYLFNAIKFVLDDPYNKKDVAAKNRYLNLLQAQLSNEELCFIFYDAISKYGKNKNGEYLFRKMLDENQFLENIDQSFLLNRNHYKFYPNTSFKFLNRTELEAVGH